MPTPSNPTLYNKVKRYANSVYSKNSAFKSGFIVKTYKKYGGTYIEDDKPKDLQRWFKEQWTDINPNKTPISYPVYRPTKIISKDTPLIASEIKPSNLKKQIKLKQIIKGKKNLPKFIAR